jgi:beta-lysine N6-acetyltransferase
MTAPDAIIRLGNNLIQHGHYNDRIYGMKISRDHVSETLLALDDLAGTEGYTKIFVKVPGRLKAIFEAHGYLTEATIPSFFNGKEDMVFMAKYLDPGRREMPAAQTSHILGVISACYTPERQRKESPLPEGIRIHRGTVQDGERLAAFYRGMFASYPFPIDDPAYIRATMEGNIRYFVATDGERIVAAASCELDPDSRSAEMTDFATSPAYRGKGIPTHLLRAMEAEARREKVLLAYTIARAAPYPVNAIFARAGYEFAGTLVNNTNICGSLESMNVWYKRL